MRVDFGCKAWMFPEPVLMIGTYDENGTPNLMNAAWGGMYDYELIQISLSEHKTTANLRLKKAFTLSFATKKTLAESDYFGIESGNKVNKIERTGFHAEKAPNVDAPMFLEYPLTMECRVERFTEEGNLIGRIVNISADESILTDGKIDPMKLEALVFDPFNHKYLVAKEAVGTAFKDGMKFKK